jgi:hypothetical protein
MHQTTTEAPRKCTLSTNRTRGDPFVIALSSPKQNCAASAFIATVATKKISLTSR